ncbi:MAG: efflux transporter outer membrane subunit [Verrucomicrobiales bacterium]|nr:efflux transporter outer membrane subunit [Verrucomicrobiales bacterium]
MKHPAQQQTCLSVALACTLSGLSGCTTVGPDYEPPENPAATNWTSQLRGGLTSSATDADVLERWWTVFDDPVLTDLVERARAGNLDLRQAEARLREARAQRGMAKAALFPAVGANASASRTAAGKEAGNGKTTDFFATSLDASWELDVFGGKRRSLEAATASWQASEESLRDVQVSLLAEAALNYVEVRSYQQLLWITEESVLTRAETHDITRWRREAGLTTQLDEDQARQSLEQVRAQVPTLRTSLAQAKYRLAVLLGQPPGALEALLAQEEPVPSTPTEVAVGVPADLLRRRPDIRFAERQLAAQTAQIGVAKAELYPRFSLAGTVGVESLEYANLYSASARAAQGLAKAAWTLLDGGSIRQNIRLQTAKQEEALSLYESTVLTALEDVESALVAYANEQLRRDSLAAAVKAGQDAFELARFQYNSGLVGFQTVLDTQQSLLSSQDQLAVSQARVTSNLISLYKALGGGWDPSQAAPVAVTQTASAKLP